jgi:hypothetical protein
MTLVVRSSVLDRDALCCCGRIPSFRRTMPSPSSGEDPPKYRNVSATPHGVTTRKTSTRIFTVVKILKASELCVWMCHCRMNEFVECKTEI